jgi:hypothetical protein
MLQGTLASLIISLMLPRLCPNLSTDKRLPQPIFTKSRRCQLLHTTKLRLHQHHLQLPTPIKLLLRHHHQPGCGPCPPPLPH